MIFCLAQLTSPEDRRAGDYESLAETMIKAAALLHGLAKSRKEKERLCQQAALLIGKDS